MSGTVLTASRLKDHVERKAFAYGVPSVVATLLGEYVVDLVREASRIKKQQSN